MKSKAVLLLCTGLLILATGCSLTIYNGVSSTPGAASPAPSTTQSAVAQSGGAPASQPAAGSVPAGPIDMAAAKEIFAGQHPGVDIQTCKLQNGENGRQEYYVFAMQGGYKYKMLIDAETGEILLDKTIGTN
ncbi:PepSY domain-containing protein [Ruminococcaceae bacterium OttesenSCG-928-A16]|nr:PepSY domain-containing protein [Ruminococcaceae bacterium OttesenSCG-928-A16]